MDNTEKLLIGLGAGAVFALMLRGAAKGEAPITATRLERQVMRHKALIWKHGVDRDVEPALIAAIMASESSGRSIAPRLVEVRTITGAVAWDFVVGLMQVRLDTAKENCLIYHEYDLNDDDLNVGCGALYLRKMLDRFGNVAPAVSAYNAGPGNVIWDVSMVGGMQYVNVDYVRRVLGMIPRFRLLFMADKGTALYSTLFSPVKWGFETP